MLLDSAVVAPADRDGWLFVVAGNKNRRTPKIQQASQHKALYCTQPGDLRAIGDACAKSLTCKASEDRPSQLYKEVTQGTALSETRDPSPVPFK